VCFVYAVLKFTVLCWLGCDAWRVGFGCWIGGRCVTVEVSIEVTDNEDDGCE
jgi:hypothetical protein